MLAHADDPFHTGYGDGRDAIGSICGACEGTPCICLQRLPGLAICSHRCSVTQRETWFLKVWPLALLSWNPWMLSHIALFAFIYEALYVGWFLKVFPYALPFINPSPARMLAYMAALFVLICKASYVALQVPGVLWFGEGVVISESRNISCIECIVGWLKLLCMTQVDLWLWCMMWS